MGNHGGRRRGAGRKHGTGKYGEVAKPVRVPVSLVEDVRDFIDARNTRRTEMRRYATPCDGSEKSPFSEEP